jgi:serine phosphatase RsbU (regulator of sigma subunit)
MEVWGGNTRTRTAVTMPGNDVQVIAEPWRGDARGGDIYFMSNCLAGIMTRFMLADVAGHGDGSGDLAVSLRGLMRKHINTADQSELARSLNREFAEHASEGRFATALLATYFAPTDHLILCNAGHPSPLWWQAGAGRWSMLSPSHPAAAETTDASSVGVPNLPLGILEPMHYAQFAVPLEPGDQIVFYTDALIEAPAPGRGSLGEAGLLALCADLSLETAPDAPAALLAGVRGVTGGDLDDDATVICIRHHAGHPPRPSMGERARALSRLIGLR